jgi:ABC-type polysaccharide/polyol phosphate export permease
VERFLGLPEGVLFIVLSYNPVSLLIESYRKVIYGGLTTDPVTEELMWTPATLPDFGMLALIFASGIVITTIGTLVFKRLEPAFAKVL